MISNTRRGAARQKPILELSLPDGIPIRVPVPARAHTRARVRENAMLRGFDWRWQRGEQWGLVGANGSGKTLLLRIISGEQLLPRGAESDAGARLEYGFRTRGKEPQDCVETVSLERQREAMEAFDFYAQMRWNSTEEGAAPTLADFLSHDCENAGAGACAGATARRRRIVAGLGLRHLLDRSLAELSSGENRRAFLARALLRRPKLLLLDSPFLGLDPGSAALCLDALARAAARDGIHILSAAVREDDLPPFARKNVLRLAAAATPSAAHPTAHSAPAPASARSAPPAIPPPSAPKKIVELTRMNISYGAVRVFKDFSWSIGEGERWLLRGANGAGKSTLIALMLGDHLQSYSNDVRLFGRQRGTGESLWEIKARIGWVSPELHASLDPSQTVLEAVLSGFDDSPYALGRHTRKQRAAARVRLSELGLCGAADASFASLNSGAQRLALISRALVKEPPLLLLDEPCQNLDDANTRLVFDAVDFFCETHPRASLVYVTHRAGAAPRSANRELRLAPYSAN